MKHHPVYNHLIIHEDGRIFSEKTNKFLKHHINKGYAVFSTRLNGRKNKAIFLRVHRLVAETYIENTNNKPFVNHIDGNKLNNSINNLEWVTSKENMIHASKNNLLTVMKGTDHSSSKLTEEDVMFIRKHYKPRHKTYGARVLAEKYNVHHSTILDVYNNITYTNI